MIRGIFFILLACLIWGAIFVIPHLMPGFGPFEVALGRYIFYGLVSLAILALGRFQLLFKFDRSIWMQAFWLGLAGNILYYFLLVVCMRNSGASLSALMLGISPITIAWVGNWKSGESSFKGLIFPSFITAIGLGLVNYPAMELSADGGTFGSYLVGLLAGFAALGLWTWYAIASKVILTRNPTLSASEWATILGVSTFASVVFVTAGYFIYFWDSPHLQRYFYLGHELPSFILGTAFLGIACSWLGFYLWSRGSAAIPMALAGQLLIFETLFGLVFVYFLEMHLPTIVEWVGMLLMLIGIIAAMVQTRQEQVAKKAF